MTGKCERKKGWNDTGEEVARGGVEGGARIRKCNCVYPPASLGEKERTNSDVERERERKETERRVTSEVEQSEVVKSTLFAG